VRAKGGGQFPFVEGPVGRAELHETRRGAGEDRVRAVIFVEGLEDHGFITRIDDGHHGGHHRFRGAAANGDFALGIDGDALSAREFFDDGVAQGFRAPGDGVLIDVVGDGLARGFLDFFGRGKIGKSLGKINGVVLQRQARHFANDGFGELLGLGGKHAAGDVGHVGFGSRHGNRL